MDFTCDPLHAIYEDVSKAVLGDNPMPGQTTSKMNSGLSGGTDQYSIGCQCQSCRPIGGDGSVTWHEGLVVFVC